MAIGRYIPFTHHALLQGVASWTNLAAAHRLDAASDEAAIKFIAPATMTVTHVDAFLNVNGTVTDATYTLEIQTSSSDLPSGTPVGTATAAFAGPAASGFLTEQALGSSASLTINTPYWLVLKLVTTGSTSGANYVNLKTLGSTFRPNQEKVVHGNAGVYADATSNQVGVFALKDSDSKYYGFPMTADIGRSGQTDIYGSNRQGIKFTVGAKTTLRGVGFRLTKSGSPSDLLITVYEGSTSKYTETITAANLTSGADHTAWFTSPVSLASDTACYITLDQAAAGGTDANDWDVQTYGISSTYIGAFLPPDTRFLAGSTADPTSLTVVTTEAPVLVPYFDDAAADFDETAGGGGGSTTVFIHTE